MSCPICFGRFVNPQILNCGHSYCLTCIRSLENSQLNYNCPECRQQIISVSPNYSLRQESNTSNNTTEKLNLGTKKKFIIYDNSFSTRTVDACIYSETNGLIKIHNRKYRYEECKQRVDSIVEETLKNSEEVSIYLLNKISTGTRYVNDVDFVVINTINWSEKKYILERLLDPKNICGSTPLAEITNYVRLDILKNQIKGIMYTIIFVIDGEPNNQYNFEYELKKLIMQVPCLLIFNMVTDDDNTIGIYNDLDVTLNKDKRVKEMSPIVDVLDDFKSEAIEVYKVNPWLTYSMSIHKKRMMGVKNITFDLIDEDNMSNFHIDIFIRIILDNQNIPDIGSSNYFSTIDKLVEKKLVFDIITNSFKKIIDVRKLRQRFNGNNIITEFTQCNYLAIILGIITFSMLYLIAY